MQVASQSICTQPWCSTLELGDDAGRVVIEDLRLFADGPTVVSLGELPIVVDGLALRLYGQLLPTAYHGNNDGAYVIEPGEAHFMVTGFVGGRPGLRWVSNATRIEVNKTGDGWMLSAFAVTFTERLGGWEATIPATVWD